MALRIGLVSAEYPPAIGGVGDHTARLAQELAAAGHHVDVLTTRTRKAAAVSPCPTVIRPKRGTEARDQSVQVLRIFKRWDFRILLQAPRVARQRRWDILHIQYQPAAYALHGAINALPWALRSSHPAVVTTFHDLRVPYLFPKAGPLRRAAVAVLAKRSDAVIAVAESDLPQLQYWRARRSPATTQHVPLGDQLDAPLPDSYAPAEWRAKLGLAPHTPLIAHIGLVNRSKGVLDLVEALPDLPDAHLLMIGERLGASDVTNAAYLAEVSAALDRRGLQRRVHWTGFVDPSDLVAWLGAADAAALPFLDGASLRRTSLITCWRRGIPVVTTEPDTRSEWCRTPPGSAAALYVPPANAAALAAAVRRLLSSADERAVLVRNGAAFAERFAWAAVVRQTVAVYGAALSARRGRAST